TQTYLDYSNDYRDHIGDPKWEWMLCVHYLLLAGQYNLGVNGLHWGDYGIFIQDQVIQNNGWLYPVTPTRRTVMLHEYGHHINIIDRNPNGEERYCVNLQCAMARQSPLRTTTYPFYCAHHWSEHRWPGW
ncbi:MAG: hypothetical protein KAU48_06105, partial [Candidatus Thorarchaeota archaeon]|nr:hypothetical protein [Candidatus Thorarchaeota archaeon]